MFRPYIEMFLELSITYFATTTSSIVERKFVTCQRDAVRVYKPKQSIGFFSNPSLTFNLLTGYDLPRDFLEVVGIDWIEIGIT